MDYIHRVYSGYFCKKLLSAHAFNGIICELVNLSLKYQKGDVIEVLKLILFYTVKDSSIIKYHKLNTIIDYGYQTSDTCILFNIWLMRKGASPEFIYILNTYDEKYSSTEEFCSRNIVNSIIRFDGQISKLKNFMTNRLILSGYQWGCVILGLASLLFRYPEADILEILELVLQSSTIMPEYVIYLYYSFSNNKNNSFSLQLIYNGATPAFIQILHNYGFKFDQATHPIRFVHKHSILHNNILINLIYCHCETDSHNNLYFIKYLIENGIITVSKDVLFAAVEFGTLEIFQFLLDNYVEKKMFRMLVSILIDILNKCKYSHNIVNTGISLIEKDANILVYMNTLYYQNGLSTIAALRLKEIKKQFVVRNRRQLLTFYTVVKHQKITISSSTSKIQCLIQKFKTNSTTLREICAFL